MMVAPSHLKLSYKINYDVTGGNSEALISVVFS